MISRGLKIERPLNRSQNQRLGNEASVNGGFVVIAPGWVHSVMREMDIVFGCGNVAAPEKVKNSGREGVGLELCPWVRKWRII